MTGRSEDERLEAAIRGAVDGAVERLAAAEAPDEALARFVAARRRFLIPRRAEFVPVGRVWHLGVFLIDRAGALYRTGTTTRAVPPGHPGHQSVSAEVRREYRAAAFRGPFAEGETINFDASPISMDVSALRSSPGPLFIEGDRALVLWNPAATAETAIPFPDYLAERVELLTDLTFGGAGTSTG